MGIFKAEAQDWKRERKTVETMLYDDLVQTCRGASNDKINLQGRSKKGMPP